MLLQEWQILEKIPSLPKLAERLGVADTTTPARLVHNWIKGRAIPSSKNMNKIMKATNGKVSPNDFYTQ